MTARSFLDTNVLVYTDDRDSPEKQAKALDLFERLLIERNGVVSTQVLQEYFAATTRKLGVPADTARRKVEIFAGLEVIPIDVPGILAGIDLHRLHRISIWDALILYAARASNCRVLFTEDMQSKRRFEGLEIVNPFL